MNVLSENKMEAVKRQPPLVIEPARGCLNLSLGEIIDQTLVESLQGVVSPKRGWAVKRIV